MKAHLERLRPVGVPFGTFIQIWSLPVDLISQKSSKFFEFLVTEFVRAVPRVLMTLEML